MVRPMPPAANRDRTLLRQSIRSTDDIKLAIFSDLHMPQKTSCCKQLSTLSFDALACLGQRETQHNPTMAELLQFQLHRASIFKDQAWVGGEWVEALSGKRFSVIGTVVSSYMPRSSD
jgi:hypothetical protein